MSSSRWTSFVSDGPSRGLHEEGNPRHRPRVEHDRDTLLVHLSDEEGTGWTTFAIDRATRKWAVGPTQKVTAVEAHGDLRAWGDET